MQPWISLRRLKAVHSTHDIINQQFLYTEHYIAMFNYSCKDEVPKIPIQEMPKEIPKFRFKSNP